VSHFPLVQMEFHVSRQARDRYDFDQALFTLTGNVLFANFHAARVFAQKMNARRDLVSFPEQAVRAGQLNALGLVDEIMHMVVELYRQQLNPLVMEQALEYLKQNLGSGRLEEVLRRFAQEFPPLAVYRGETSLDEYLAGVSLRPGGDPAPNQALVLEELLMLWLANMNPAFSPFLELFDDSDLTQSTRYLELVDHLRAFFDLQPPFGPDNQNLIDMLRAPALAHPHSLTAQLEFLRTGWFSLLGKFLYRLLSSLDLIKEEEKAIFGFGGPGPALVYEFAGQELEVERFSQDREWMPNLVLLAKNSYVWLDQLSRKYKRSIRRLDQVPEEELDMLARWGFTGLWLIGLWERSPASKKIKQMRGNMDAVASAYSLSSYDIAQDLGGYEAYQTLRERAWKRGIRLASDMVPNHMGIDSPWVIHHPDWFVSLDYSPFPSYTFNGPNLSWDERVGIFLEDHYYDSTDAAVVFKRVDYWSGSEKYIYHGNDGTSMPWNDTAQLNYLNAEVREAVIQTILKVARMFPVIRFDAAMTLAKKHYQRLWFPQPGSGGDIPSRAEHAMTKERFDELFLNEFWRDVVDRVAQEAPDTLLLAEAFWLMEGYFVRTLGMHRVYNSAFMNMLRDEKNQEYRLVIKNTLEFDPEILKRYVNFMNNPDERTAVDQFGKGDKYFGIAILMTTMPGLPMFGHGQVEGYAEKYGMEFQRAYWEEYPDPYLVDRHERQVFPLLRRRYLFAGVENFWLYDFYTPEGHVNEDVYAFSNRVGNEHALVLYHNKFASTRGWVRTSAAASHKQGSEKVLVQVNLGEGLGLSRDSGVYIIFRDAITGLEYIRSSVEIHEQGFYTELDAYRCQVFMDFREVEDDAYQRYAQLASFLGGSGVPDVDEALKEIFLQPIHQPFNELVHPGYFRWLIENRWQTPPAKHTAAESAPVFAKPAAAEESLQQASLKVSALLREVTSMVGGSGADELTAQTTALLSTVLSLPALPGFPTNAAGQDIRTYLQSGPRAAFDPGEYSHTLQAGDPAVWGPLLAWTFIHRLGAASNPAGTPEQSRTWLDEWLLGKLIARTLQDLDHTEFNAWRAVTLIKLLTAHQEWAAGDAALDPAKVLQTWLTDREVQAFLGVNRHQGVLWFNREAYHELLWWLFTAAFLRTLADLGFDTDQPEAEAVQAAIEKADRLRTLIRQLAAAEAASGYQLEKLIEAAGSAD
jgi:glycosidase